MNRADLVSGVRQWWALDRAETVAFALYMAVVAGVTVIAGAALWLPVAFVVAGVLVPAVNGITRRARQTAAARELSAWMDSVTVWPHVD